MRFSLQRLFSTRNLFILLFIALVLFASPVCSRPTSEAQADSEASTSQLSSIEKSSSALEHEVIKADTPRSKKPAKRSQGSFLQTPNLTPESVSLTPQIPDPDKKGSAVQGLLLNILQPKPIVDTIREEDKYGNTGDKFAVFGRGVVTGAEGVSQVLLKVLDFPFEAVKKVSRSATEALNNLGSKLIGL